MKDRLYALLGTIVFHVLLLLLLAWLVLYSKTPDISAGGVWIDFGYMEASSGALEANPDAASSTAAPPVQMLEPSQPEQVITQQDEESVALDVAKEKEAERKAAEEASARQRDEETQQRLLAEQKAKHEAEQSEAEIANRIAGAFGISNAQQTNQGTDTLVAGNQGSLSGNSDQTADGQRGAGGSFDLNGRTLATTRLPRPNYATQEEGRIVISITVNPEGDVIFAEIGRGTNIGNATMRRDALQAARRARFNIITGSNNQNGTVTYTYKLK